MSGDGTAIHSTDTGHDDPCKTLVRCKDGRQQDTPNLRYDANQHNGFFSRFFEARFLAGYFEPPLIDRERVDLIEQTISPPFHPPELLSA